MTTFYRDRVVRVETDELVVRDRAYRFDDLELVWHRKGPRGARGMATIVVRIGLVLGVLGAIAAAGIIMRGIDFSKYDSITVLVGAVVAVVLAGTVGLFLVEGIITLLERYHDRGGVEYQIWARHHGAEVMLFGTRDRVVFGQVYRALQRAIEHHDG